MYLFAIRVHHIDYEEETLTAILSVQLSSWNHAAEKFDIEFFKHPSSSTSHLHSRNLLSVPWGDIADHAEDNTVVWNFDTGDKGKSVNVFTDPLQQNPRLTVDCIDCYIKGTVNFSGNLKVENFVEVKELTWSMNPTEFTARMELDVKVLEDITDQDISLSNYQGTLFDVPITGISIPGIFSVFFFHML